MASIHARSSRSTIALRKSSYPSMWAYVLIGSSMLAPNHTSCVQRYEECGFGGERRASYPSDCKVATNLDLMRFQRGGWGLGVRGWGLQRAILPSLTRKG